MDPNKADESIHQAVILNKSVGWAGGCQEQVNMRNTASSVSWALSRTKQRPLLTSCLQACAPAHALPRAQGTEKATSLTHLIMETEASRPDSWALQGPGPCRGFRIRGLGFLQNLPQLYRASLHPWQDCITHLVLSPSKQEVQLVLSYWHQYKSTIEYIKQKSR